MAKFSVWHTTGKFDGDSSHATLADAKAKFDHQRSQRGVVQVELIEETDEPNEPVVIQSWSAGDCDQKESANDRDQHVCSSLL